MDIDKDIDILKEVQAIFEHLKNHGWVKDITKEVDIDKVIQAIEKVLWALKGKDCVIETQSHNEEVLEEYIAKLEKELDIYKKISEWLIRYSIEKSIKIFGEEKCEYAIKNKNCPNFSEENCIQCIIEWARKEVEK